MRAEKKIINKKPLVPMNAYQRKVMIALGFSKNPSFSQKKLGFSKGLLGRIGATHWFIQGIG